MKVKYFNIIEKTLDEIICARVLFGLETVTALDNEDNELATIKIDHIYSVEE